MMTKQEAALQRLTDALSKEEWVVHCRSARPTFPAVVTYLAQFMAHDMTFTAQDVLNFGQGGPLQRKTHNLRATPLRLMTLYGPSVRQNEHLFSIHGIGTTPRNISFRLNKFPVHMPFGNKTAWAPDFSLPNCSQYLADGGINAGMFRSAPRLADMRNADQPMVLFVALTFMRLHNYYVLKLPHITDAVQRFETARLLVTQVWHDIIRNDILGLLAPEPQKPVVLAQSQIDGHDPAHGVMRALHALPLNKYQLHNKPKNAPDIGTTSVSQTLLRLKTKAAVTFEVKTSDSPARIKATLQEWWQDWGIDIADFASHPANMTNVMPALPSALNQRGLFRRDMHSADHMGVPRAGAYPELAGAVAHLYEKLTSNGFPHPRTVPLSFAFLAEAYFADPSSGGLGPIGAALFSHRIKNDLAAASVGHALLQTAADTENLLEKQPDTFAKVLELLN